MQLPFNKLVIASGNKGKLKELAHLLAPLGLEIIPQAELNVPEAEEPFTTFIENALTKARHASKITGLPALADDSGLCVDALQGAPGVISARYAGVGANDQTNLDKLLVELQDVPLAQRTARFICVMVYLRNAEDPTPIIAQGVWEGLILVHAVGENGFGYDPVFWVAEHQCSSAQLAPELKNALSHRGQALRLLQQQLSV